ncbi:MAG: winged helix-turn-helix transcriptional regulator [Ardenticatenaceae bacterium]|nr:winged helix-turn-helix transcriptional regulator [Ardenticatenaceae bacterium]MCB9444657.1 winged helix-turn-helix transcriptional regulator [Ardenticatenaceae bacterium]
MAHWLHDKKRQQKWTSFVQALNPNLDPQTLRLMDEFQVLSRAIHHLNEQSVAEISGLSFAQYRVLMHLFFAEQMDECSELNPSEISHRQGVSRNTMSSFIRNLEDEGYVERRLDPHDRRRFKISLTENGRSLVTENARQNLANVGQYFMVLTNDEQETLSHLLRKIGEHIRTVREQRAGIGEE